MLKMVRTEMRMMMGCQTAQQTTQGGQPSGPWVSMGSPRVHGVQETESRGDQAVVGCSWKTQFLGSCDVHVLLESVTSFKSIRRTRNKFVGRGALKITAFRLPWVQGWFHILRADSVAGVGSAARVFRHRHRPLFFQLLDRCAHSGVLSAAGPGVLVRANSSLSLRHHRFLRLVVGQRICVCRGLYICTEGSDPCAVTGDTCSPSDCRVVSLLAGLFQACSHEQTLMPTVSQHLGSLGIEAAHPLYSCTRQVCTATCRMKLNHGALAVGCGC